jgi:hypothetical protein
VIANKGTKAKGTCLGCGLKYKGHTNKIDAWILAWLVMEQVIKPRGSHMLLLLWSLLKAKPLFEHFQSWASCYDRVCMSFELCRSPFPHPRRRKKIKWMGMCTLKEKIVTNW